MKYTVSLLLFVAISHAAETSNEDDNKTAKRELLEGNFGLKIQPAVLEDAVHTVESQPDNSGKSEQQNVPSQEYDPPRTPHKEYGPPVAKISDSLTGQGPSISAAIDGHLNSPVSIYKSRPETPATPATFEVSQPVPSQLRYSEHRIFNDNLQQTFQQNQNVEPQRQLHSSKITQQHNYEKQQSLEKGNQNFNPTPFNGQPIIITQGGSYERQENVIQNFEPQKIFQHNAEAIQQSNAEQAQREQQKYLLRQNQQNLQNILPPRPDVTSFLPRLESIQSQPQPIYSEQIIQQIYPQVQGFPPDFFQQINQLGHQLGNQLTYSEETVHYIPAEQQEAQKQSELQNTQQQTSTERQISSSQQQYSTIAPNQNTQSQSNDASSQGPPPPSNVLQGPRQQIYLQPLPSPSPLPQFQQPPQPQPPQLFQPLPQLPLQPLQQTTPQPLPLQPLFQPFPPQPTIQPLTSVAPPEYSPAQSSQRIGIIRIRQRTSQLPQFPQNPPVLTTRPQTQQTISTSLPTQQTFSTIPQNQQTFSTQSQNDQTFTTQQPQVTTTLNSEPTFTSEGLNGLSNDVSNNPSIVSTTVAPRSTAESFSQSTERSTTPDSVSIVPKFVSTLPTRSTFPAQSTTPPQVLFTSSLAPSTSPPQPVTEAPVPAILTSIQTLQTLVPVSQTQAPPVQTSEQQPIQLPTQPSTLPTLQPVQLTSLQSFPTQPPLPVTQPQPLPTQQPYPVTPEQEIPGVRAVPVQRFQSEYQPLIEVQEIEQQQPVQLLQIQSGYPVQIQLQPTVPPPPQLLQIQIESQSDQQQQSYSELEQQQFSQQQNQVQIQQQQIESQQEQIQSQQEQIKSEQVHIQSQQQQSQSQFEQNQQTQLREHAQTEQEKAAAIAYAQELLFNLYTPFLQQPVPVFTGAQDFLIQQPHLKAASLAFPSTFSPSLPPPLFHAAPAYSSTQYFGKYAQGIFGGHHQHHPHHHPHHYHHHHHSYKKK